MADAPGKDVFDEDDPQDVQDLGADGGAEQDDQGDAAADSLSGADSDIEIVIGDQEDAGEGEAEAEEAAAGGDPGEAAAEEPEGEEDKGYSRKVRDRIDRERAVTRRTREEAAAAIISERKSRIAAERRAVEMQEQLASVLIDNLEGKIKEQVAELKAAKEAGETDREVDAQSKLDDLRAKRREVEASKDRIAKDKTDLETREKEEITGETREVPAETRDWLSRNKWFGNKAFLAETSHARLLDRQVSAECKRRGIPEASPEYFKELDKAIARDMPDLRQKVVRVLRPAAPQQRRGPAPVPRASNTRTVRTASTAKKRFVLTPADMEQMRTFRMDPTNKEHQIAFAKSKLGL